MEHDILRRTAELLKERNRIDHQIAEVIDRPMTPGHLGGVTPLRPARFTAGRHTRSEKAVRRIGAPNSVVKTHSSPGQAERWAASASTTTWGSGTTRAEAWVFGGDGLGSLRLCVEWAAAFDGGPVLEPPAAPS